MKYPIARSKETKYSITSVFDSTNSLTPAISPPSTSHLTDKWQDSDWISRFVYRQRMVQGRFVRPLPYDAYGRKEVKRPTFALESHAQYRNTTPWASPWRTSDIVRTMSGTVPRVPALGIPQLPEPTPEGALLHACLSRASSQSINLAVTLAEMGQTASMISARSRKMAKAIQHVRKGRFRAAANTLGIRTPSGVSKTRRWSDNFLEYNYGWLPLISDVCGAAQYLAEFLRTNPVLTVSARVSMAGDRNGFTNSYRAFRPHDSLSSNGVEFITVNGETTSEDYHQVVLNFCLRSQLLRELDKLGALNPANVAVELTTLSFVVGWFVNVQDVLSSYTAASGLDFLSGCYTRMRKSKQTVRYLGFTPPVLASGGKYLNLNFSSTDGEYEGHVIRRTVYDRIPPPELIVALPGTQQWRKAIVSAALLRQRLS